jgi:cysteine dioxygenase
MAITLQQFIQYLDGLTERPPLDELIGRLVWLEVECGEVAEHIRFSERGYTRNLVRGGPWYHLLVLCWKNGQRSPIHDHAGSACAVRVLRGIATETQFVFAPNGHVKAVCSVEHPPGSVLGSEDRDLHQISNLQPGMADLVTLHVYAPPLLHMGTYSLTDLTRGTEPMFIEFADAAGI